jgi:hypothetical protein
MEAEDKMAAFERAKTELTELEADAAKNDPMVAAFLKRKEECALYLLCSVNH